MPDLPIIQLDSIDSTNNYAMQLIDADKALHGLTIVAQSQTAGKGQRGKTWTDAPGQSLLMSVIVIPWQGISSQFAFNGSVATAIVKVLQFLDNQWNINIKWPNDIIVNDKKAGGILIENVLRGSQWLYSVIGLGLNVKQGHFPPDLPNATSLKIASGKDFDLTKLGTDISESILSEIATHTSDQEKLNSYNRFLYKKGAQQSFTDNNGRWDATIVAVHTDGTIELKLEDGSTAFYHHGQILWDWGI